MYGSDPFSYDFAAALGTPSKPPHGDGLTSIQSLSLAAHSTSVAVAKQSPEGVAAGSAIGQCQPPFDVLNGH